MAEPSKHIRDLMLTYQPLICLFISLGFPELHRREVGGRSLIYLFPFFFFLKMWVLALTLFRGMASPWHWGEALLREVGGFRSSSGGVSIFLSPSDQHRC